MVPLPRLLDRLEELDELEVIVVLRIRVLAQFGDLGQLLRPPYRRVHLFQRKDAKVLAYLIFQRLPQGAIRLG